MKCSSWAIVKVESGGNGEGMGRAGKKGKGGKGKGGKDKGRIDMGGSCRFWHVKNARILLRARGGRRF